MLPAHVKACLGATLLLLTTFVWALHGAQPLSVDLYPRQQIAASSATVRVRFIVERDAHNRVLAWAWESTDFSGASQRQLDGVESPRVFTTWLKALPPGDYTFTAVLVRNDHSQITRAVPFRIIGAY